MPGEALPELFDELPLELRELPDGWRYVPLRELVDSTRGVTYGIVQPGRDTAGGVPIVRVQDIVAGRIETTSPMRVEPSIAASYRRTHLKGGELLLTLVGSVGNTAVVPPELAGWNTARAVGVLPILPEFDSRYVGYCLQTRQLQEIISAWCTTTVQATFNLKEANQLPIPIAPARERAQIVRVLGALDDKIELNRRLNETLEGLARAVFRSWFVDFDPVVAKAAGRRPIGMTAETAALFPSTFEDSPLGPIPKGWTAGKIGDLMTQHRNSVNPSATPLEVFDHYSIPAFDNERRPVREPGAAIKSNKYLIPSNALLLSKLNPDTSRIWVPQTDAGHKPICSTEFIVAVPKLGSSIEFL